MKAPEAFARLCESFLVRGQQELRLSQLPARQQKEILKRKTELHPSSFPICPLRKAYEIMMEEDDPNVYSSFGQDYYLNIGTTAHTILQRWLGASGKIYGNWLCHNCKAAHAFCSRPAACRKCKSTNLHYLELGGVSGSVHWHTDGLFKFRDQFWSLDYKTTSDKQLAEHRKTGKVFPYKSNQFQIEGYVPLIEEKYNIQVSGYILAYVSRSEPNKYGNVEVVSREINDADRERWKERLARFDKAHKLALQVKERPVAVFKKAISTKLCDDREFYETEVHTFYSPCPLAENNVCFSKKKLIPAIKELL